MRKLIIRIKNIDPAISEAFEVEQSFDLNGVLILKPCLDQQQMCEIEILSEPTRKGREHEKNELHGESNGRLRSDGAHAS